MLEKVAGAGGLDGPKQKESVSDFLKFSSSIIAMAQDHLNSSFEKSETRNCLWGFSQGGAAALTYTLLGKHPLHKSCIGLWFSSRIF